MGANATTTVPVYVAAEVLTAADLNITNSGIPVFATTVTRDAAFGGAGEKTLAEGQFAYLEDTNATQYYDGSSWTSLGTTFAIFNETQAASTNGGSITAATWTKRTLNTTQINQISGCSIASSVITLGAGTYSINAQTPGDQLDNFKARLQNTSDSTTTLFSQNAYTISSAGYATVNALIMGVFTITSAKNFELQMYSQVTSGATGLGRGVAAYTSLFSQIQIQRLA
jgi:hypothetical protein